MNRKKEGKVFQWDASDYADHSSVQQKWAQELMSKLNLKGDESLLDIGCGDGKVTAEISSYLKSGNLIGIDNSEAMVSLANEKFSYDEYPNLSFLKLDARKLSFNQDFDVVFSNAALHWVLDHRPVLKGIYTSLKPGGRVVVQMGGKGNAFQVVKVVNQLMETDEWKRYFDNFSFPYGFYSPEEYSPWLQEAGFVEIDIQLKPKEMVHENAERFKGWFRTTWLPYLQRLPIKLQEKFINDVSEKYLQINPPDQEGKVKTEMQRLEFTAATPGD